MRKIINIIKGHIPKKIWLFFRKIYYFFLDFFRQLGPKVAKRKYCGLTLYYNRGSGIIRRLKKEPIFEELMCKQIVSELSKNKSPVMLDIGANLGLISSYVVSRLPNIKIFAFEPGETQNRFLKMTITKNCLQDKINLYSEALSKEVGQTIFYAHDPQYSAGDGLLDTGRAHMAKTVLVNVNTVDNWWEKVGFPKIQVVKIDTEGAELWILQGATKFLKECRPVIFLEVEPLNLRVYPYSFLDIYAFMQEIGYEIFDLSRTKVTEQNFKSLIDNGEDTYVAKPKM